METTTMNLKILLPFKVFLQIENVKKISVNTIQGSYGLLPHRLDCAAALVPGILSYETDTIHYVAIDEGILTKTENEVSVSVRNAIGGVSLGELKATVAKEFINLDEDEKTVRSVMAKLESNFIQTLEKYRRE